MPFFPGQRTGRVLFIFVVPMLKEGDPSVIQKEQEFQEQGTKNRSKSKVNQVQRFIARIDQYILRIPLMPMSTEHRKLDDFFELQKSPPDDQEQYDYADDIINDDDDDIMDDI